MSIRYQHLWISIFLFFACPIASFAQTDVKVINYNASNGLPQNSVLDMGFDCEGLLWICSFSGLVRFDGSNFKVFDDINLGIKNKSFSNFFPITGSGRSFARNLDGSVFELVNGMPHFCLPTPKGFSFPTPFQGAYCSENDLRRFNLAYDSLEHKFGWEIRTDLSILPLSEHRFVVIGQNRRRLLFYENGIKIKESSLSVGVKNVFSVAGRAMFIDSAWQLYSIDKSNLNLNSERLNWENIIGLGKRPSNEFHLFWDRSNNLLFGSYGNMIYRLAPDENQHGFYFRKEFDMNIGIHEISSVIYEPVSRKFFLGTLDNGLYIISLPPMKTLRVNDLLPPSFPVGESILYCIHEVGENTAITTSGVEISEKAGKLDYALKSKNPSNRDLMAVRGDTVYTVWQNQLSYTVQSEGYRIIHHINLFGQFGSSKITLIFPESDSLWVFSNKKIVNIKKGRLNISKDIHIPGQTEEDQMLRYAYRPNDTVLWLGNRYFFLRLDRKGDLTIDSSGDLKRVVPRYVFKAQDTLVISTIRFGVFFCIKNRFYKLPFFKNGYGLEDASTCYVDPNGFLWLSTNYGLFVTPFHEAVAAAVYGGPAPFFYRFAEGDGIDNPEFNGGGTCNYAVLRNGRVLYPSMGGVVTFIPTEVHASFYKSAVLVESIMEDNHKESYANLSDIRLQHSVSVLTINLLAACYTDKANQELSYQLDSAAWETVNSANPKMEIRLFKLGSGQHRLLIRKRTGFLSNDFIYSTIRINVEPGIFETWWFWVLMVGGLYFLMVGYSSFSIRASLARERNLELMVAEQTVEMTKELKTKEVLLSVITHDMIAPLNYMTLISDIIARGGEKDDKKISEALVDIRDTSSSLLSQSQNIVSWIKYTSQKIDMDISLLDLKDLVDSIIKIYSPMARENEVLFSSSLTANTILHTDRNILSIIINNLLSNAVKYSEKGTVEIKGEQVLQKYKLSIIDTGKGMSDKTLGEVRAILSGTKPQDEYLSKGRSGMGYFIIADLVKIAKMDILIDSSIGKGTKVELYI